MAWELDAARAYLSQRDARMAAAIREVGETRRGGKEPLFDGLMDSIIGQQISIRAADTIGRQVREKLGPLTPEKVAACAPEDLAPCGVSGRKASYMIGTAEKIALGAVDLDALAGMTDAACIECLSSLRGIGRWTAEMLMIFSMERQDVLSFDDLGIRRGLCMLYHHKEMTRSIFERYRRRFSPYGTAASLILWDVAAGHAPASCAAPLRQKKGT